MESNSHSILVNEPLKIFVKAHSNLEIKGTEENKIETHTEHHLQKVTRGADFIRFVFVEDSQMSVPRNANLIVERVSGNARIESFEGELSIHKVSGSLFLKHIDAVSVGRVSDNVVLQNLTGSINFTKVSGHLQGENIKGSVLADQVSGNVKLFDLYAGAQIRSSGAITLGFSDGSAYDVNIKASGKVDLSLPINPDVLLNIKSRSQRIRILLDDKETLVKEREYIYRAGLGTQNMIIDTSSSVKVNAEIRRDPALEKLYYDLEELWANLREEAEMKRKHREQNQYWELKMLSDAAKAAEGAIDSISELSEKVTAETLEKVEQKVMNAWKEVQEEIDNLDLDVHIEGLSEMFSGQSGENREKAVEEESSTGASADEKLVIMKLLEEKKITMEEADQLLDALENS